MIKKIKPYVDKDDAFKRHGMVIETLHLDLLKDSGFLRLYCKWSGNYRFKRVHHMSTMYAWESHEVNFRFSGLRSQKEIVFGLRTDGGKLDYSYIGHQNIHHGVIIFFSPKTFNDGKNETPLFCYEKN